MFCVQVFVQDDVYYFCMFDQFENEIYMLILFFFEVYGVFGLDDVWFEFSIWLEKFIGSDEVWEKVEFVFQGVFEVGNCEYQVNFGDGVFYGLKIDFYICDLLGWMWQCGMIQVDFFMFDCFGFEYVGVDGVWYILVMVYCVCYGLFEWFFGIIIEYFVGVFLLWFVFEQVCVLLVLEKYFEYVDKVVSVLWVEGLWMYVDSSDEWFGYKICGVIM